MDKMQSNAIVKVPFKIMVLFIISHFVYINVG